MVTDSEFKHFFPRFGQKMASLRPGGRATWYICRICHRAHPRYMATEETWRKSGFRLGAICKHCLEMVVPDAKYESLDEYVESHKKLADNMAQKFGHKWAWGDDRIEAFKNGLLDTWDKPEEEPPAPCFPYELIEMQKKGICTIQYAKNTRQVRSFCKKCCKKGCPGPYMLGDWEKEIEEFDRQDKELHKAFEIAKDLIKRGAKPGKDSFTKEQAELLLEHLEECSHFNFDFMSAEDDKTRDILESFFSDYPEFRPSWSQPANPKD